jgi:hypothetical protein
MPHPVLDHVVVTFRHGHGASFTDFEQALGYAEREMQTLLGEHEDLSQAEFEGIFCEQEGFQRYWRFDYEQGIPAWLPLEDSAAEFDLRVGVVRHGGTLRLATGAGPTDAANDD